jgi:hypothetical protein
MPEPDLYGILGLTRDAAPEDVKRAYRNLAKKHHPDLNSGDPHSAARFRRIARAYAILGDPLTRTRYDRRTEPPPPPQTAPPAPPQPQASPPPPVNRRRIAPYVGAGFGLAVIVLFLMASPSATVAPGSPGTQLAIVTTPPLPDPPPTPLPELAEAAAPQAAEIPAPEQLAIPAVLPPMPTARPAKPALAATAPPPHRPPPSENQVAQVQAPPLPPPPPYTERYPLLRRPAARLYYYYRWLGRQP